RKINFGWWLEMVSTPLVTAGLVGAFTLLLLRRQLPETPSWIFGASGGAMVALIAAIAWLRARKRFETPEQSMVRIEAAMHLRNALSAARAGVTPWPSLPPKVDVGLDWRWPRVIIPPLAAVAFLAAGILIPVATGAAQGQALEEPLAWGKIEADLQRLSQEEVIDESHLEETKRQLEELRKQKEEEWFSHSSLEATDALKKQHQSDIRQL